LSWTPRVIGSGNAQYPGVYASNSVSQIATIIDLFAYQAQFA